VSGVKPTEEPGSAPLPFELGPALPPPPHPNIATADRHNLVPNKLILMFIRVSDPLRE
jgi:hypothetical protein